MPQPTHISSCVDSVQERLFESIENQNINEVQSILRSEYNQIDLNRYNSEGFTSIQAAVMAGSLDLVKMLVQYGGDPSLHTRDGFSTLHLSAFIGNSEILQYIMIVSKRP